ncbi:MAG: hypothetical protein E7045_04625 [Lentisphaerae bacterium]|nr:hypothetical protein [Lentisphaerota bacterium]
MTRLAKREYISFIKETLKGGLDFIACDFSKGYTDNVTIRVVPLPGKDFLSSSDEEIRVNVKQVYQGMFGFNTEIYEIKRLIVAGHPCIFVDLSHAPTKQRVNNYVFPYGDKSFSITLDSKLSTFEQNKKLFDAALKTLKIGK